jgi:hypothetical protein
MSNGFRWYTPIVWIFTILGVIIAAMCIGTPDTRRSDREWWW